MSNTRPVVRRRVSRKMMWQLWKLRGLCPRCGQRPPSSGKVQCESCRERMLRISQSPRSKANLVAYQSSHRFGVSLNSYRHRLKHLFNMTVEQYDQMVVDQGGLCAICNQPETKVINGTVSRLSVDHNHETNEVRQLLCSRCNLILGWVKDDIAILENAAAYLRRHGTMQETLFA